MKITISSLFGWPSTALHTFKQELVDGFAKCIGIKSLNCPIVLLEEKHAIMKIL